MRRKHHHKKKHIFAKFLEYGFHLWILLFVSNLLIFYTFSLFGFAAESDKPTDQISAAVSPSASESATVKPTAKKATTAPPRLPTRKPNGPRISLAFSVPGIGSGGGTLNPTRTKRALTVYLYATDVNSNDNKVKPLYSVRTTAEYDSNPFSPTFTAFVNPNIELGDTVKNGKYQIAFVTEQSLRRIVKDKEDSIGGKIVAINQYDKTILPIQKVITGDISPPQGNNVMDIADYNVLVECYGQTETNCPSFKYADLNDDALVDGIDYNIMTRSFKDLVALGIAPPSIPTPVPSQVTRLSEIKTTPKLSPSVAVSPKPVQTRSAGNPFGAILGFFFFMLLLGGAGFFVATRTKFGKAFLATHPIPFLKQSVAKKPDAETPPAAGAETPDEAPIEGEVPVEGDATSADVPTPEATTETIAESTEIPIEEAEAAKTAPEVTPPAETPTEQAPLAASADTTAAPTDGSIDKTYYVKNKSKDDKGTWVVLTDDAGPIDGLLPTGTIEDGFERIKGTLIEEKGQKYVLISEVLPSE